MRRQGTTVRSGMTLLELLLALVIFGMVGAKVFQMMAQTSDVMSSQEQETVLDDQANRVLKMIAYNIMASDRDTLAPAAAAPLATDDIRYRVNLGLQDGEVVWKDPEEIGQDDVDNDVYWRENPDVEAERRVVWTRAVAPFLEGEIPDGMDNNGNGLIDEKGLSFVVDGDCVTIRMTLEEQASDGTWMTRTVQTTVTCRNVLDEE